MWTASSRASCTLLAPRGRVPVARVPQALLAHPVRALHAPAARPAAATKETSLRSAPPFGSSWAKEHPRGWCRKGSSSHARRAAARHLVCLSAATQPDVLVVLAGGMTPDGGFPEWVLRRLDEAVSLHQSQGTPILCTGGWTPHKPALLYPSGQVMYESSAMAEYLLKKGVDPLKIYKEWGSYDTIGNGYYALTSHIYPRNWRNVAVVTSDFHMPRSKAIFEWIFSLAEAASGSTTNYTLSFVTVTDDGIDPEMIASRQEREAQSLKNLQVTASNVTSLEALHEWFHSEHRCYAVARQDEMMYVQDTAKYGLDEKSLKSY